MLRSLRLPEKLVSLEAKRVIPLVSLIMVAIVPQFAISVKMFTGIVRGVGMT